MPGELWVPRKDCVLHCDSSSSDLSPSPQSWVHSPHGCSSVTHRYEPHISHLSLHSLILENPSQA